MKFITLLVLILGITGCSSKAKDREKAMYYLDMANTQIENNNLPTALKDLLTAEKLDPTNPVVQNNLGLVYFLRERYETAVTHFAKAVRLQPDYTEARNNYGRALIEVGKYSEAEDELKLVINDLTYVAQEKGYINMGILRFNQKQYKEAAKFFEQSLKIQTDNCIANNMYGRSLFEQQNYVVAVEALDRAVGFCQKRLYDEPHYYSALAYYRLGNREKSIARFQEILKYYPSGEYRDKARGMIDLIRKGH